MEMFGGTSFENTEVKLLSRVPLFATPWTVAYQASLSMGFSRQEYWSGLPFPSPRIWKEILNERFQTPMHKWSMTLRPLN